MRTFFFYDLETSGLSPREDRIMQFAGQRTDEDLKPIGGSVNLLVKMAEDTLPHPGALMVTGITPQQTQAEGLTEAELSRYLYEEIFTPETVAIGYNNVRFDDEFLRYLFWRSFYDPYEWSWKDGRSRWDLLDVVRMTRALRPEGIEWPVDSEGKATNRLELITKLNGISHEAAHDALSDVQALIDTARLICGKQPKLFDFLLRMRDKNAVKEIVGGRREFVYCSGRYDADFNKCTVALPIGEGRNGSVMVFDLREDACAPDFDFDAAVKELALNRCPAVAPIAVLDAGGGWEKIGLSKEKVAENKKKVLALSGIAERVRAKIEGRPEFEKNADAEAQLYDGFLDNSDRLEAEVVRRNDNLQRIMGSPPKFKDKRLTEMFPRYKARNFPKSLSSEETEAWENWRAGRIRAKWPEFMAELQAGSEEARKSDDKNKQFVLDEVKLWAERVMPEEW